ncbi:hypothetical protein HYW75_00980 [Candidatus Pacearchaeota archaeon]|nr:hypothetical protein [Candidatus Pacearchaeota archaeon]
MIKNNLENSVAVQIPKRKLIACRLYLGRGRNSNITYWNGINFLTIGFTFRVPRIKTEKYFDRKRGKTNSGRVNNSGISR